MKRLRLNKRGISNVIVVMLSLVLIVIVVANVILWSYEMNQLDWERMQEKITLANAERITHSPWFTSQNEYAISVGSRLNGTYAYTQTVDANYETFREELAQASYNPTVYNLIGSTKYVSGTIVDLAADNDVYMTFRSYSSAFSSQTTYAHSETTIIAGTTYYQLKLASADSAGVTLSASGSTTGRKLLGRSVYPLIGITSVPASTWTVYYRGYKTGLNLIVHCDADILIRRADGTTRTTVATGVANSVNLNRDTWSTVSGTYAWGSYTVVEETDFLEVDYYAHVTTSQSNRNAYLRIDDSGLALNDQTRVAGMMLPSKFTTEIELTGLSNLQTWQSLTWTVNSAFTATNVNTTLQLYNYNTSQYPTSGDGFTGYTSSATPNTDETRNQTITANPAHFRGSTGEWKTKIIGVKETNSPFNLKVDWVELKVKSQETYRIDIVGEFALDVSTYLLSYARSVELQVRYRAIDSYERWFLKAYNWTNASFSDAGFNSTAGDIPTTGFRYYTVNLTNAWQSYVRSDGTIRIEFCDIGPDVNQTIVDVDFLGARTVVDGVRFSLQNDGSVTCHLVALWVLSSTVHKRYDVDFFFNSGVSTDYVRVDVGLPQNSFIVKAVTERGNIAVLRSP
jgi:hypothetical protein